MATNENVNKVIYGNQTVMDITDTTAEESDVASGEVFYKADGSRSVGTLNADSAVWGNISGTLSDQTDLQIELNRAYTKTASETSSIDDLDLIPVQKISASSDGRRNIKFRNLKSVLKTYFDDFYSTFSGSYNDLSDKPTIPTVDQTYSATSSNAQSGKAVASAISGKADTSLLKSTVGWTGKNLLPNNFINQTINGVTCTKDTKGIINLNGTCTGATFRRIYIGNIPNGTYNLSDNIQNHNDCNLYINAIKLDGTTAYGIAGTNSNPILNADNTLYKEYDIGLYLKDGIQFSNLKVYPMLRDASITDDTYDPYHESVEEVVGDIRAEQRVLGAKNLLPNNATSQTINGVTFTVNSNGTISLNGTATDNTFVSISDWFDLPAGDYILNGSATDKIYIYIQKQISGGTETIAQCLVAYPDGVSFNWDGSAKVRVRIVVENGQNTNDKTIYPMLRLASDPDDTYVPYAMTNRELTEKVESIYKTATADSNGETVTFTNVDTSKSYSIEADLGTSWDGPAPSYTNVKITGTTLIYTLANANAGQSFRLIDLKR